MNLGIAQHDGLWWPVEDIEARPVITRDCEPSIAALLPHVVGRACIVQAGANIGTYPLALADHFRAVFTAEPDPRNYDCLKANLTARDALRRVTALHAAFGETEGECSPLEVHAHNCGAHRVSYGKGAIPVWTIDGLELTACDAIWLDVEGSELFALKGAADTIERFSPIIAAEDKGLDREFFDVPAGSLQVWLADRGYVQIDQIGRDKIFRRTA